MSEQAIFKNKAVDITTKVARFGAISFQVSTIGSVSVFNAKKISPWAIALIFLAVVSLIVGSNLKGMQDQQGQIAFAIAATFLIGSFLVQKLWPRREFTFVLRSGSGEVYKLVSDDGEYLETLQRALEMAFVEQA
ncbi:MAG: hypothetical protein J0G36_09475 [Afipia sp.]|nr:hypothetical protein [Afipia sp.]